MEDISYENVKPNVARAEAAGTQMNCTFRCPVTSTEVQSSAAIPKPSAMADKLGGIAKKSVTRSLKYKVAGLVRGVLGRGMLGRAGGDMVREALKNVGVDAGEASEDQKQAAVVDAFRNVQTQFTWDAKNNRWISAKAGAELIPELATMLGDSPITQAYDRKLLARMLCEVASADGNVDADERALLEQFITPDLGKVDDFLGQKTISATEFSETASGPTRDVMLALAWCMAFTDGELDTEERGRLNDIASGLGISPTRGAELESIAQRYLLDVQLEGAYSGGKRDDEAHRQAMEFAARIGLAHEAIERVDIRVQKRVG